MDDSFVRRQSEMKPASRGVIYNPCEEAPNSQAFRDPDEHRRIFRYSRTRSAGVWAMSQRQAKNIRVGLPDMDKAGGK